MLIKTGAESLYNQERTAGNSESHRALPSLYGRKFLLRTDHASLTWLLNSKTRKAREPDGYADSRGMILKFSIGKELYTGMWTHYPGSPEMKAADIAQVSSRNMRS